MSLETYNPSDYPARAVTVDAVVSTIRNGQLCVLLVRRGGEPYQDCWALPGGFVDDETLDEAVVRELREETGLAFGGPAGEHGGVGHLEQLRTYGNPGRDPRMRVISVAYFAVAADLPAPEAGSDAADVRFWPVDDLDLNGDGTGVELAFDHNIIVNDALDRIRAKFEYTTLATKFCDRTFSMPELRRVYETVWGAPIDPSNFARKATQTAGFVKAVGAITDAGSPGGGRRAQLYEAGDARTLHPPLLRPEGDM